MDHLLPVGLMSSHGKIGLPHAASGSFPCDLSVAYGRDLVYVPCLKIDHVPAPESCRRLIRPVDPILIRIKKRHRELGPSIPGLIRRTTVSSRLMRHILELEHDLPHGDDTTDGSGI